MTRLVSSPHALRILVALDQRREGARVSELAKMIGTTFSATQRAVELLAADGLVSIADRQVRPATGAIAAAAVTFALAFLEPEDAVSVIARSNEVVEFAGADDRGIVVVRRRFAPLEGAHRLRATMDALRELRPDLRIEVLDKTDLRDRQQVDLALRRRAEGIRVLAGSVDRTFPDRTRHGDIGRASTDSIHPDLPKLSRRRLGDLARRYRLSRIDIFGSAARKTSDPTRTWTFSSRHGHPRILVSRTGSP